MRQRIRFYTRSNCHLCESARYVLERAIAERDDVTVEYVDIDGDPSLRHYNDHVPVILLDGTELARHRLDPGVIAAALKRRET